MIISFPVKYYLFLLFLLLFIQISNAQSKGENWYSFQDKKTKLFGFKDSRGNIKIPAKFDGFSEHAVFKNVIAIWDTRKNKSYYLLKNGKVFGVDSVYIDDDNGVEQVAENKLRFRDKKHDKVGFFDITGKVVIPAIYDDASPFINGLSRVTYKGKRKCLDGSKYDPLSPCEHRYWDGTNALINSKNRILADKINFNETDNIDWFSLRTANFLPDTNLYTAFKGTDHKFYYFLNYKKEFNNWFYKTYLTHLNASTISRSCFKEILVEDDFKKNGSKTYSSEVFLNKYKKILLEKMLQIKTRKFKAQISSDYLDDLENDKAFSIFYDTNKVYDFQKHPVINVVVDHFESRTTNFQDQFFFIRYDKSYKLFQVVLNNH